MGRGWLAQDYFYYLVDDEGILKLRKYIEMKLYLFATAAMTFFCLEALSAKEQDYYSPPKLDNRAEQIKVFKKASKNLFDERNWDDLEKLFTNNRNNKSRLISGEPSLKYLYLGIGVGNYYDHDDSDDKWMQWYEIINDWEIAYPDSIVVPVIKLDFWCDLARKASNDKRLSYSLRINRAYDHFKESVSKYPNGVYPCPHIYFEISSVVTHQKWSFDKKFREILIPLMAVDASYFHAYSILDNTYKKSRDDEAGDVYKYYKFISDQIPGALGDEVYARLLIKNMGREVAEYRVDLVDWDILSAGMMESIKNSPKSSLNVRDIVSMSIKHGKQIEIVNRIKELNPDLLDVFYKGSLLGLAVEQHLEEPVSTLEFVKYLIPESGHRDYRVESLLLDSLKDEVLAAYAQSGIMEVSSFNDKMKELISGDGRYTGDIFISPNQKTLLSISKWDSFYKRDDKLIKIYRRGVRLSKGRVGYIKNALLQDPLPQSQKWKLSKKQTFSKGVITSAVFSKNSNSIYFLQHEGPYDVEKKEYECCKLYRWDWRKWGESPALIRHMPSNKYHTNLILSDDEKTLYMSQKGLVKVDLTDLRKEPVYFPFYKTERILKMIKVKGDDFFLCLTKAGGADYVVAVSSKRGKVIEREKLKELYSKYSEMEVFYNTSNKPMLAVSGANGCISTWNIIRKEGDVEFTYESTLPTQLLGCCSLIYHPALSGEKYLLQGLVNGYVGVFKILD